MFRSRHIIDLDADPHIPIIAQLEFIPKNHPSLSISIIKHRRIGRLVWDPTKLWLYSAPNQTDSNPIYGDHLWERDLAYRHVLNANLLDYLLVHQELIPEEWKNYEIYFWGTIYQIAFAPPRSQVRCLRWSLDKWESQLRYLIQFWGSSMPAAILDF